MIATLEQWTAETLRMKAAAGIAEYTTLVAEASHRLFYRIADTAGATWIVMASPPELENNDAFVNVARRFADAGVGVPRVVARDDARGFFLLTDLGDYHFADAYAAGETDRALAAGLKTLARIQRVAGGVPRYDRDRFATELDIFTEWFVEGLLGVTPPAAYTRVATSLVDNADSQRRVCIHRDYHSRNLLLTSDGEVGVVDFQDALMGPYTYDLACLLLDCYHRFDQQTIEHWANVFRESNYADVPRDRFLRQLELTGLQRQLKAVGIFARLKLRDNKSTHLRYIVPVLSHAHDIVTRYPDLVAIGGWLDDLARRATESGTLRKDNG